jgi:hypothetical protein
MISVLSDEDEDLGIDLPARVARQLNLLPKTTAPFNVKVLSEESRGAGLTEENLKRLRSVERQLLPRGVVEVLELLECAVVTRPEAIAAFQAAVESKARGRRDPREGLYKCVQRNGVGIRDAPKEATKKSHGPGYEQMVAVETVVVAMTELAQELSAPEILQRDIDAALDQIGAVMGADIVRDMNEEMGTMGAVQRLEQLSAIMPLQLPSQQASADPMHEVAYLKLVGGGFCPVQKTPLFAPFIYINEHFTKTGSGQT